MKKILCAFAALSLLGVACSREDSVSSRAERMYDNTMDTEIGTGASEEVEFDSEVGEERDSMMDESREDLEMQREEEMVPMDEERRGTGTGAGSSDAAGMGMDE